MDKETLKKDYEQLGTLKAVGDKYGVSVTFIRKRMNEFGIPRIHGWRKGRKKREHHFSKFVKWVEAHPDTPLPPSIREIARVSDCSYDSIKSYLYRRRKKILKKVKMLLPFNQHKGSITDVYGIGIPFRFWEDVKIEIENFSFNVKLNVGIRGKDLRKNFIIPYQKLIDSIVAANSDSEESTEG